METADLRWVRRRLDHLGCARIDGPWHPQDEARYQERCRLEREILLGSRLRDAC